MLGISAEDLNKLSFRVQALEEQLNKLYESRNVLSEDDILPLLGEFLSLRDVPESVLLQDPNRTIGRSLDGCSNKIDSIYYKIGCDLHLMPSPPPSFAIQTLPNPTLPLAYILCPENQLFYVNKVQQTCVLVEIFLAKREAFRVLCDQIHAAPATKQVLNIHLLRKITEVAGHRYRINPFSLVSEQRRNSMKGFNVPASASASAFVPTPAVPIETASKDVEMDSALQSLYADSVTKLQQTESMPRNDSVIQQERLALGKLYERRDILLSKCESIYQHDSAKYTEVREKIKSINGELDKCRRFFDNIEEQQFAQAAAALPPPGSVTPLGPMPSGLEPGQASVRRTRRCARFGTAPRAITAVSVLAALGLSIWGLTRLVANRNGNGNGSSPSTTNLTGTSGSFGSTAYFPWRGSTGAMPVNQSSTGQPSPVTSAEQASASTLRIASSAAQAASSGADVSTAMQQALSTAVASARSLTTSWLTTLFDFLTLSTTTSYFSSTGQYSATAGAATTEAFQKTSQSLASSGFMSATTAGNVISTWATHTAHPTSATAAANITTLQTASTELALTTGTNRTTQGTTQGTTSHAAPPCGSTIDPPANLRDAQAWYIQLLNYLNLNGWILCNGPLSELIVALKNAGLDVYENFVAVIKALNNPELTHAWTAQNVTVQQFIVLFKNALQAATTGWLSTAVGAIGGAAVAAYGLVFNRPALDPQLTDASRKKIAREQLQHPNDSLVPLKSALEDVPQYHLPASRLNGDARYLFLFVDAVHPGNSAVLKNYVSNNVDDLRILNSLGLSASRPHYGGAHNSSLSYRPASAATAHYVQDASFEAVRRMVIRHMATRGVRS